jgi:hypothetical protein
VKEKLATIQRFPRLIDGSHASALAKLISRPPSLSVEVSPNGTIEFRFAFGAPEEIRTKYAGFFDVLYDSDRNLFRDALHEAFNSGVSGDRTFLQHVHNLLRRAIIDGLGRWLIKSYGVLKLDERGREQLRDFIRATAGKTAQQPDPLLAFLIAQRVATLRPAIKGLRRWLKKNPTQDERILGKAIPETLELTKLRDAVSRIRIDSGLNWIRELRVCLTDQEVIQAYLQSEIEGLSFGGGKPTLEKYIEVGEELIKGLSWQHDSGA